MVAQATAAGEIRLWKALDGQDLEDSAAKENC